MQGLVPLDQSSDFEMFSQKLFTRMLSRERKRTGRSRRRFVLMLLDLGMLLKGRGREKALENVLIAVSNTTRDTDITGWYEEGSVIGVIFTEIGAGEDEAVVTVLSTRVTGALYRTLTVGQINEIKLSFHAFPEDWDDHSCTGPAHSTLHLALAHDPRQKRASAHVKRLMDIVGSIVALILFFPVLIAIAIAIKLTSRGPVLFRQVRLGQYGKRFTFLKFRSMYFKNDASIHEQYVKRFIAGRSGEEQAGKGDQPQYKLTADPRVTPIGRFLRKTSLDELPQFLNVLKGDMSLVGPRPPVTYEYECYDLWHRERLLGAKPGITGLWQVYGRSRVKFDDMVRLDIRYARSWSLWLDIKILLQTPWAIMTGDGAH